MYVYDLVFIDVVMTGKSKKETCCFPGKKPRIKDNSTALRLVLCPSVSLSLSRSPEFRPWQRVSIESAPTQMITRKWRHADDT